MRWATANEVRCVIARGMLSPPTAMRIGSIQLRDHQVAAVADVKRILRRYRGALLADSTGLGKTFVALALARDARRALVIGPAAVCETWKLAMSQAAVSCEWCSVEALSRGSRPPGPFDLVIVDEAHHFRNARANRYPALADICAGSAVLLLSATPVHNTRRELANILALFLGARAHALAPRELNEMIVRRTHVDCDDVDEIPSVLRTEWMEIPAADDVTQHLLTLPPSVPLADGEAADALLHSVLLRLWCSSAHALRRALVRRLSVADAILASLAAGSLPTRQELRHWIAAPGAVQLMFPELIPALNSAATDVPALLACVSAHRDAVQEVVRLIPDPSPLDESRAARIADIHRSLQRPMVVFSQFAETVDMLWSQLRTRDGVCAVTAAGARVAGGRLSRRDAMLRFAPVAHGAHAPRTAERITMLLTTDLLSEGINLQDAGVVVHVDLPWTPARLEQRVGRVARRGSPFRDVHVLAFKPPASADLAIRLNDTLRRKTDIAHRTLGATGSILTTIVPDVSPTPVSPAESRQAINRLLATWNTDLYATSDELLVATVECHDLAQGWLALVEVDGDCRLVASLDGEPTSDDVSFVARVARAVDRATDCEARTEIADIFTNLEDWLAARRGQTSLLLDQAPAALARRKALDRLAGVTRKLRPHERITLAPLVSRARSAALVAAGAGPESVLGELATSSLDDHAWLQALAAFGEAHSAQQLAGERQQSSSLLALIVIASLPPAKRKPAG